MNWIFTKYEDKWEYKLEYNSDIKQIYHMFHK